MRLATPKYIVGIDLGTTHTVLAYTKADLADDEQPTIQLLEIPQIVSPGEVQAQALLPSFLLLPGAHEVPEGGLALPWQADMDYAVGEYARTRGWHREQLVFGAEPFQAIGDISKGDDHTDDVFAIALRTGDIFDRHVCSVFALEDGIGYLSCFAPAQHGLDRTRLRRLAPFHNELLAAFSLQLVRAITEQSPAGRVEKRDQAVVVETAHAIADRFENDLVALMEQLHFVLRLSPLGDVG